MDLEPGTGVAHLHAGVQQHPQPAVAERQVDVVDGLDRWPLDADVGPDRVGHAEQLQGLVDQVRPEVPEDPDPGTSCSFQLPLGTGRKRS